MKWILVFFFIWYSIQLKSSNMGLCVCTTSTRWHIHYFCGMIIRWQEDALNRQNNCDLYTVWPPVDMMGLKPASCGWQHDLSVSRDVILSWETYPISISNIGFLNTKYTQIYFFSIQGSVYNDTSVIYWLHMLWFNIILP